MTDAQLDLSFCHHPDRGTHLDRRLFRFPFTLSRSFQLDLVPRGMRTVILQTVSGAVLAEDALLQRIEVGAGAAAHVTTQGASSIYRAATSRGATDAMEIDVGDGGIIEYLPEPRVLFPDSRLSQRLALRVASSAIAVVSDAFVQHDPVGQDRRFHSYTSALEVSRPDGAVIALDRIMLDGRQQRRARRARLGAHATLLILAPLSSVALDALCGDIAERVGAGDDVYAAASVLPETAGAVLRVAATDGRHLRLALAAGWASARRCLFGAEPAPRRKDAA